MSARLTIRFSSTYQGWITSLGGDQAEAVRALMTLGAAVLELPGALYEARGLLRADLPPHVKDALLGMADKRQTSGRQAADTFLQDASARGEEPAKQISDDPFLSAGVEV